MNGLTTYEIAWLAGGEERVALVALGTLAADGRLVVGYKRQRVKVARDEASDPVETAALALVPETGLAVHEFVAQVAATDAVAALEATVRAKGQPRLRALRWFSPAYRDLFEHPGTGLRRVAILGVPGIEDTRLRDMFENPRPDVPKIAAARPVRDNTFDGSIGPSVGTNTAW